jgi:hypothetical protein
MVLKCRITLYDDVPTRRKAELADAELTKEKATGSAMERSIIHEDSEEIRS